MTQESAAVPVRREPRISKTRQEVYDMVVRLSRGLWHPDQTELDEVLALLKPATGEAVDAPPDLAGRLREAILEYQLALADRDHVGDAVWQLEHQRKERRVFTAANALLEVAALADRVGGADV